MRRQPLKWMGGAIAAAFVALALIGCRGATGQAGQNGTNGTNGSNGSGPTVNAANLTPDEWGQLTLKGSITGVVMGGAPVVSFTVTDGNGTPVKGLGFTTKSSTALLTSYGNFGFVISKLVPGANGSPSRWVCYNVTSTPTVAAPMPVPRVPTTDNTGTLVDNGDGSYRYTFYRDITQAKAVLDGFTYSGDKVKADLDDVSYQPALTHRIAVQIGGNARGTGTNTADGSNSGVVAVPIKYAANLTYDFIPATGQPVGATDEQRIIVSVDACNQCHAKLGASGFHGANRFDPLYCVVCHTTQLKYGFPEATTTATGYSGTQVKIQGMAVGDFPNWVHKIHMGEELQKDGYNVYNIPLNETTYPQDHRNCVKCHSASTTTPQGDNWFSKPSRLACGACHDQVQWATGVGHGDLNEGGPALGDNNCSSCHDSAAVKTYHIPVLPPNPNNIYLNPATGNNNTNASFVAGFPSNLPPGTKKVTWDLNKVELVAGQPTFTFRFLVDGTPVLFDATAKPELMPNFVGGPSVYLAMALPQDGIATPADWNATVSGYIRNIWNGTATGTGAGTMTGPDASGYYKITLTGVVIPASATMMTGGIGYSYGLTATQPLTQTDVPGYPYNTGGTKQGGVSYPAPNVSKLMAGQTGRRTIVSNQKCNACHGAIGLFTAKTFHAGQRNDAGTCSFCHNVERVNNGWGVNQKDFIHAIHGAGKREQKFSWEAAAGDKYWTVTYPGVLKNCEACHVPGSYDFANPANLAAFPNLLWTTVATGTVPNPVNVIVTGDEPIPGTYWSPYVTAGAVYGKGFTFAGATGTITQAETTTLVNSPYVSACAACHDSSIAVAHMKQNGGSFYQPRATAFANQEQCFLCHSSGKIADVKLVHMNFK